MSPNSSFKMGTLSIRVFVLVALAGLRSSILDAAPITTPSSSTDSSFEVDYSILQKTLTFFLQYDYLDNITPGKTTSETLNNEEFRRSVRTLQHYANIDETGELNAETMEYVERPRCGVSDPQDYNSTRSRRYNVAGGRYRWDKNLLTYKINSFPGPKSTITRQQMRYDISQAFKMWSDVSPLVFAEVYSGEADIVLEFGSRDHAVTPGDPAFDGEGGTLAHAFTPNSGWGTVNGDVHYDDDEVFTHKSYSGINFFYTTAHEIGHSLGLDHSDNRQSLMWPWDRGYIPNFKLPQDDILGIQEIYGPNPYAPTVDPSAPATTTISTTPPRPPVPIPPYCNTTLDAVADIRGSVMVFKNDRMWRFRPRYNADGTPDGTLPLVPVDVDAGIQTAQFFVGIKKGIKAVYEQSNGLIIFLKPRKKWIFSGTQVVAGSVDIVSSPTGVPQNVVAAMSDKVAQQTYFFKGRKVWIRDDRTQQISRGSVTRTFPGLHPSAKVEGAFVFYDKKFLIDGPDYYVANMDDYVPNVGKRNFGIDILGCPSVGAPEIV